MFTKKKKKSSLLSLFRNGTYGDTDNLAAESECRACDPGYYCNDTAAVAVSGPCYAGELVELAIIMEPLISNLFTLLMCHYLKS